MHLGFFEKVLDHVVQYASLYDPEFLMWLAQAHRVAEEMAMKGITQVGEAS